MQRGKGKTFGREKCLWLWGGLRRRVFMGGWYVRLNIGFQFFFFFFNTRGGKKNTKIHVMLVEN